MVLFVYREEYYLKNKEPQARHRGAFQVADRDGADPRPRRGDHRQAAPRPDRHCAAALRRGDHALLQSGARRSSCPSASDRVTVTFPDAQAPGRSTAECRRHPDRRPRRDRRRTGAGSARARPRISRMRGGRQGRRLRHRDRGRRSGARAAPVAGRSSWRSRARASASARCAASDDLRAERPPAGHRARLCRASTAPGPGIGRGDRRLGGLRRHAQHRAARPPCMSIPA